VSVAAIEAAHDMASSIATSSPGTDAHPVGTKVLDFRLDQELARGPLASDALSVSPTLNMPATAEGIVVGTAPYMSPEQLRGQDVDRRTDVWSFGCILFECLTTHPTFPGVTSSDVVAQVLQGEPDWSALPAAVPPRLRDLIRRSLTKPAAERPRDIGDLGRELASIAAEKSSSSTMATSARPSLAVLYFANLAKDPESEYFCDGIAEDILTDLSKIKGIRVASRNAVQRYRGAPADLNAVAAELGVSAVLEGSVRRVGDRIRITTQLVNAADGFQLWAERYDRTLQDVFAVQEEIASSIAAALRVALTPGEVKDIGKNRPQDARAYDLYLKGRSEYAHYNPDSLAKALALFQQATAIDPEYALAWAGIGDCHAQMVQWGASNEKELLDRGLEAARRAIAIDPRLPEAHKAEGLLLHMLGDDAGERKALDRAIEMNPRFTPALINSGVSRFTEADVAGAERFLRRVLEVDPQEAFATMWLGFLSSMTSRPDEALANAERVQQLSSSPFYYMAAKTLEAGVHLMKGDLRAAEQATREAMARGADVPNMKCFEAAIAGLTGREEGAKRLLHELEHEPALGSHSAIVASAASLRLGDPEQAMRFLERKTVRPMAPTIVRLHSDLHALLDRPPYAPRRRATSLVWPLEAPKIDAARHALFREVRIESGIPQGSDSLEVARS
jgi:TolB-like protein/Tfp pilus assembly protein PilF